MWRRRGRPSPLHESLREPPRIRNQQQVAKRVKDEEVSGNIADLIGEDGNQELDAGHEGEYCHS